jgi:sec-independent protein translocase protein TatA
MSSTVVTPMLADLGPMEIVLILLVLVLLFGAKKLPELARGSGRALRIFKAETKGLLDEDEEKQKTDEQRELDAQTERIEAKRIEEQTRTENSRPDAEL